MKFEVRFFMVLAGVVTLAGCEIDYKSQVRSTPPERWISLFDGDSLKNWQQTGGDHHFNVIDGTIVGIAVSGEPSAFLISNDRFSDFILELEFLSDGSLNSGVMFRADADPEFREGRLFGYQAEIDPSPRSWTGGIFEEALRGWLDPIDDNDQCRASFRSGDWNLLRIEAQGHDLRTKLNGVTCADLIDDAHADGVIGLQIHSVPELGRMGEPGDWVSFRNIRIMPASR